MNIKENITQHRWKALFVVLTTIVISIYIAFTSWIHATQQEVFEMYPIKYSQNKEASTEFLKAMEYRIYIKELHPYFDYDSFVMKPLLNKMNDHFKQGKVLLSKNSVEDIVWWVLFYKDIYGLVVPPRNDNSLAYENLPPKEFVKVHDEVYEMIERYPFGEVYFDLDEIKKFRFQAMAILVEFFSGEYTDRYNGKTEKEKAQEYAKDMGSKTKLLTTIKNYELVKNKYLNISAFYKQMHLHYIADIVGISSELILKEIYQNKNLQLPKEICFSQEAYRIQENTQFLLDATEADKHQAKIIFTDLFDVNHTNNVAMFMMLAKKCDNLNPTMRNIAKRVYKLNNINK